jgi:hypothetical protein
VNPLWGVLFGGTIGVGGTLAASRIQARSSATQADADRTFQAKEAEKERTHQLDLSREQRQADARQRGYVNVWSFAQGAMTHVDWKFRTMIVNYNPPLAEPAMPDDDPTARALANLILSPPANARVVEFNRCRLEFYPAVRAVDVAAPGEESMNAHAAVRETHGAVVLAFNALGAQLRRELGTEELP